MKYVDIYVYSNLLCYFFQVPMVLKIWHYCQMAKCLYHL